MVEECGLVNVKFGCRNVSWGRIDSPSLILGQLVTCLFDWGGLVGTGGWVGRLIGVEWIGRLMGGSGEIAGTVRGGYGEPCEGRGSWCGASEGWKFCFGESTGGHFCLS